MFRLSGLSCSSRVYVYRTDVQCAHKYRAANKLPVVNAALWFVCMHDIVNGDML